MTHRPTRQAFGPSRFLRRLLIVLGVVVGLFLLVDFGLRLYAKRYMTDQLQALLSVTEKPTVEFGGFPFVLQVARGKLESLEVSADDILSQGGLRVAHLELAARNVEFSTKDMLTAGSTTISTSGGEGAITLTDEDITAYAREQGFENIEVTFGDGVASVATTIEVENVSFSVTATGSLTFDNNKLTFKPKKVQVADGLDVPLPQEEVAQYLTFEVPFERLFTGIEFHERTISEGQLHIDFTLVPEVSIRIRESTGGGEGRE